MDKLITIKIIAANDTPLLIFGCVGTNRESNQLVTLEDAFEAAASFIKNHELKTRTNSESES